MNNCKLAWVRVRLLSWLMIVWFLSIAVISPAWNSEQFQLQVMIEGNDLHLAWDRLIKADNYWLVYAPKTDDENFRVEAVALGDLDRVSFELWPGAAFVVTIAALDSQGNLLFTNVEEFVLTGADSSNQSSLIRFSSEQALLDYLQRGLSAYSDQDIYKTYTGAAPTAPVSDDRADAEAGFSDAGKDGSGMFSTTNLQESGVDEADVIKTDGRFLYVISKTQEYYSPEDDMDMTEVRLDGLESPVKKNSSIRILEIFDTPAQAIERSSISRAEQESAVDGLYLVIGRGEDRPDLLITVGGQAVNYWGRWYDPWYWNQGRTELFFYNVDQPASPEIMASLTLEGHLISSRRINNLLYLVTRYTPSVPGLDIMADSETNGTEEVELPSELTLEDLLPRMISRDGRVMALVDPVSCYLPPLDPGLPPQPSLITITAIDLDDFYVVGTATVAGPTETIYASVDSLYLASIRHRYDLMARPGILMAGDETIDSEGEFNQSVEIHKFSLTAQGPVYRASGSVAGNLGWEEGKKSFRLSEYQGTLRVATSLGNSWDLSARTRLAMLREGQGEMAGQLLETGHIDHIGEIGESLYAARYVGPRAYLVTFRVTDPLYVFDLSDPYQPQTLGELHIEGYSDYLHPVGDGLLLGIGKDAVPDTTSTDFGGRGAWTQGVKLALFDVSVPTAPREIKSIIIGKRGTSSEVLYDHHALAYLPPADDRPARIALPMKMHDTLPKYNYQNGVEPWSWYDWTHTGLYMFEIATASSETGEDADLRAAGAMVVESRADKLTRQSWGSCSDRAVLLENSAHYIHNSMIWSSAWGETEAITGPR